MSCVRPEVFLSRCRALKNNQCPDYRDFSRSPSGTVAGSEHLEQLTVYFIFLDSRWVVIVAIAFLKYFWRRHLLPFGYRAVAHGHRAAGGHQAISSKWIIALRVKCGILSRAKCHSNSL